MCTTFVVTAPISLLSSAERLAHLLRNGLYCSTFIWKDCVIWSKALQLLSEQFYADIFWSTNIFTPPFFGNLNDEPSTFSDPAWRSEWLLFPTIHDLCRNFDSGPMDFRSVTAPPHGRPRLPPCVSRWWWGVAGRLSARAGRGKVP